MEQAQHEEQAQEFEEQTQELEELAQVANQYAHWPVEIPLRIRSFRPINGRAIHLLLCQKPEKIMVRDMGAFSRHRRARGSQHYLRVL